MTHTELKQQILDYMQDIYKVKFIGELKVQNLDPQGYKVSFYLDRSENPVVIMADLPDEEFLPFIKEEIRKSKFHKVKHYLAVKIPYNSVTFCNDKRRTY